MGAIKLKHTSGNGTILNSPAANPSSDITLKLPSTTGSAGQVLSVASANHSSTNAELEFAAASSTDYVKLTSASGSSGGSAINIDNLDVSTYKAFEIFLTMQPGTDNSNLYIRFRIGSTTITDTNYVNWKEQSTPTNNVSHKSSGSQSLIEPAENIGADTEENVFFHGVMHVATSNDPTGLARQNNRIEYDTNYITHGPAHYSTRGVAHYSGDATTYVNGIRFYFSSGNISDYMYTVYGIKR
tara:strand:+ start:55 stop:780 length:726 start_codon:yes stop_codon:yes gene_type:complete